MDGWGVEASSFDGRGRQIAVPGVEYHPSGGLASSQAIVSSDPGDLFSTPMEKIPPC